MALSVARKPLPEETTRNPEAAGAWPGAPISSRPPARAAAPKAAPVFRKSRREWAELMIVLLYSMSAFVRRTEMI